ncbi:MAG: J domain-containing protein [Myxococcota bacterium]|jgi:hypothetical protein|nr:J domain-containing protein [Myxococcota bacterium]
MSFSVVFPSLAAAQAVYRTQLSRERLFVPSAQALPPQSPIQFELVIEETGGRLSVSGQVLSVVDQATAVAHGLGSTAGLAVHVPLTEELIPALRALLTGELRAPSGEGAPSLARASGEAREQRAKRSKGAASVEEIGTVVSEFLQRTQGGNHYQRLGVESSASMDDIRRAYLKLMRLFHPDNYFKRIDDDTMAKLELAYQAVTMAFETLIDQRSRDKYDIDIGNFSDAAGGSSADVKRKRAELEEYKAKNAPRIRKAKELWDAAMLDEKAGKFNDAISKVKLAINFDPQNPMFPRKLGELESKLRK